MPAHTWVWIETCSFILSTTNWNVRWIWPITRNFIACWTLTRRWTNTRLWLRFWANTHLSMLTTSNYLLEIERVRNWILISKSLRGSKCQDFLRWCCCCFEEQKKETMGKKVKDSFSISILVICLSIMFRIFFPPCQNHSHHTQIFAIHFYC